MKTLDMVNVGDKVVIKKVDTSYDLKKLLLGYGVVPNTILECILCSMGKDICAYNVNGGVIALRKEDTRNILVENYNG